MRYIAASLLLLPAGGCAVAPPAHETGTAAAQCIPLDQVVGRRVAGAGSLDFEMAGGRTYRNQMASTCPGLERLGATAVVSVASGGDGGRLCSGDRVRVFDPVEAQATGVKSVPTCLLGSFTEIVAGR